LIGFPISLQPGKQTREDASFAPNFPIGIEDAMASALG
jgi:hypothetical protein